MEKSSAKESSDAVCADGNRVNLRNLVSFKFRFGPPPSDRKGPFKLLLAVCQYVSMPVSWLAYELAVFLKNGTEFFCNFT